jgi:hypothetical protein
MITHTDGRIVIRVDLAQKNKFTFSDGNTITLEREFNNLDRAYTQQTLGIVVSGEGLPIDAMILFHFNAAHASNEIFNHTKLSGEEIDSNIKLYSIREEECFFWKMIGEEAWNPLPGYEIAERVFQPYEGTITGIEPTKLKDVLYVKTGELKGNVVHTLKASDFQITFRNEKGIDQSIIRFRPYGNEKQKREPEAIAIDKDLTKKVKEKKLYLGVTISDCKPIKT